jgi:hypothetical protein
MIYTRANAIFSLVPDADCVDYGNHVLWKNYAQPPVTDDEINAEVVRLQAAYDTAEYQRKRAAEYPPITDYIDGVVKGDQEQIDAYIAACLAVKAKYPKEQP